MDAIYKLLGIEVPAGSTPQAVELQFRGPLPTALVVVLAIFLCAGVAALYWTERGKVGLFMRILMGFLRTVALVLLLLLVARPVLQAEFEASRAREIALLLDNSQSMKQQDRRLALTDNLRVAIAQGKLDPGVLLSGKGAPSQPPAGTLQDPPRAALVREVLNNPKLRLLEDFQKHGALAPLLVGADVRSAVPATAEGVSGKGALTAQDVLAGFDTEQTQTALADAIISLLQRQEGDLPAAIVVMSDGRDNASKYTLLEAAQECARLRVPLHIYGTGAAEPGRLKLRELAVQETLFAEDNVTIPIRWRADGIEKGTAVITVTLGGATPQFGGKSIEPKKVAVESGQDQVMEYTFTVPKVTDKVHKTDFAVSIALMEDDSFKDELKRSVQIIDGKVKVFYAEYSPRKEFAFLQPTLLRDRRIDPRFWLITADKEAFVGGPFDRKFPSKKELAQYDVVILGDVPASELKKADREALAEYVKDNRGGLVILAGRQNMPASFAGVPEFTALLPVEFAAQKFALDGVGNPREEQPQFTSAGLRTDWLMLKDQPDENAKQWKELPGIFWHYPVSKLRPGAVPLLVHKLAKMGDAPMPLAAMHHYGKGQVLFLGFEESWRWRFNTQDKVFARFWGQLLLHMALPHKLAGGASQVELSVNRAGLVVGKPAILHARLLDSNFMPYRAAQVEGVLEFLDAKPGQERSFKLVFDPVAGREKEGEYQAILPNQQPGRWQVQLSDPSWTMFPFSVALPPMHEQEEAALAAEALRTAASVSGGRYYQEESLHDMAKAIQPRQAKYELHQEVLLWGPMAFLIFAVVVTCEWVLRKFANMS